jgi:hypothetical protein
LAVTDEDLGAQYAERAFRPRELTEEDQDMIWSLLATKRLVTDERWDYGPQFGEDDE